MKKGLLILLNLFIAAQFCLGQAILPKGFAIGEEAKMPRYIESVLEDGRGDSDPPEESVRTMAEWEELDAVVVTWTSFPSILTEIVRAVREETTAIIVCNNETQVKNYLLNKNVDISSNVEFVVAPYNSIWIRDYGPNSVYINNVDSLAFVDWIYNRPRYLDNQIPDVIGDYLGVPVYSTNAQPNDLVNTGGNFMVDGLGYGFSSDLVLDENGPNNDFGLSNHSEEAVDDIMLTYMGVEEYVKMEALPYDLIHHIDMHMKLLDERTLLVGEYPEGVADGPQIEANIQYVISNFTAAFGREFEIVRMIMPPGPNGNYPDQFGDYRTYTNSLIANGTIIVPTYEEFYDTTALRQWQELMPGYEIVGIDCNAIIPYSGALHCITKEVGTSDPLQISHSRLDDIAAVDNSDYSIEAIIRHKSSIDNATVYYTTDLATDYTAIEMTLTDADNDLWAVDIPEQELGSTIYYYIQAESNSAKVQQRPFTAPEGYFKFKVEDAVTNVEELSASTLALGDIYPNPASAITVIPVKGQPGSTIRMELRNNLGQLVDVLFEGRLTASEENHFLFADRYPAGTYYLQLVGEQMVTSQKVLIQ